MPDGTGVAMSFPSRWRCVRGVPLSSAARFTDPFPHADLEHYAPSSDTADRKFTDAYDVDVPAMLLNQHGCGIHALWPDTGSARSPFWCPRGATRPEPMAWRQERREMAATPTA